MSDIEKLDQNEKILLAGCIKSIILADGKISTSETEDIDKLYTSEHFNDFEECLEKFESKVKSEEDLWTMAKKITNEENQSIILGYIYEFSIQDGYSNRSETQFINKLKDFWKKD